MVYTVELARTEHLAALAVIEIAAGAIFSPDDLPPDAASDTTEPAVLAAARSEARLWVVTTPADTPVGFALAGEVDGGAHLLELCVHPEHARQRLGARLVEAVVEWARQRGGSTLTLTTFAHVPWNRPYYERLGFRVLGEVEIGSELAGILRAENESGLRNRVGMVRPLGD